MHWRLPIQWVWFEIEIHIKACINCFFAVSLRTCPGTGA